MKISPLTIAGHSIKAGETVRLRLQMPPLYTDTSMHIPIEVRRGKRAVPVMFVSAAIHADELNGIEIINRLHKSRSIKNLKGTLITVPMVNVYGVLNQSLYLPDRRDLNRCFPGSRKRSLGGRIAHLFVEEIIKKCDVGIDLHTGAIHRSNLPQIRANCDDIETLDMAKAFSMPVILNADLRDGSMRETANELGNKILLYEAGEALRYDEFSIRVGVKGIINVMREIGLLNKVKRKEHPIAPYIARQSGWVRANESGLINHHAQLGDHVSKGEVLGTIANPYGDVLDKILSPAEGVVIGKQNIPLTQEGEAVYHIAYFHQPDTVAEYVELLQDNLDTVTR